MGEFFRACNVYCRLESNQAIVAAVYNHGGLIAEKPGGSTVVAFLDSAALKQAIQAALRSCEYKEEFDYSGLKPTDWPAFQASGYKTVERFEKEFVWLGIRGVNKKNFFYEVSSPEFGDFGLQLRIVVNANTADYGDAVKFLIRNYVTCKAATEPSDSSRSHTR